MKQGFGFLDHCIFDHLRYFLFATGSPFFILFFVTRFLGVSSLLLIGIIGMAASFSIVASTYFAWGRDALVRHRQTRRALIFAALPCALLHLAFLITGWALIFIVKIHWHFSTVFLYSTLFPPMSAFLGVLGVGAGYFADERVVPAYWTVIFLRLRSFSARFLWQRRSSPMKRACARMKRSSRWRHGVRSTCERPMRSGCALYRFSISARFSLG